MEQRLSSRWVPGQMLMPDLSRDQTSVDQASIAGNCDSVSLQQHVSSVGRGSRRARRRETLELPEAKRGFVLLPKRWVVERSFAWAMRCRRLVEDYERYASTLAGFHIVAFVCFMLKNAAISPQVHNTL
jgi:hypothetical protein